MTTSFIADIHLGKLARMLRLLGIDTLYSNKAVPQQLTITAREQNRILLSKSSSLTKELSELSYTVLNSNPTEQLKQVLDHFQLMHSIQPFTRCLVCNGVLQAVPKDTITNKLKPNTREAFNEFWQCSNCMHIYWKGSHYERMLKQIELFKKE